MPLTILAQITAAPGQESRIKAELTKLIAPTRVEAGCITYDLHQDNDNPAFFVFYENWETRDLWQAHMSAPHLAAFSAATTGAVESLTVHELTKAD